MTVSGLPGSGKTTASREVAKRLGLRHVYAGAIFRELAAGRRLTLAAFGRLAEEDPRIDVELDDRMVDEARKGDAVIEGRLAAHMMIRHEVRAFKVWLDCREELRASRVAGREHGDAGAALAENRAREASEAKRYRDHYAIDLHDRSLYDLVLDTSDRSPQEVVEAILAQVKPRA